MEKLEETALAINDPISGAVLYALDNHLYEDAIFLAERYYAEVQTFQSLWLLGTSYYRNGEVRRTVHLLKKNGGLSCPKCVLLYATCCYQLREFHLGLCAIYALVGGKADENVLQSTLYRPLFVTETRMSEDAVLSVFQEDSGLAFQLLGQLNRFDGFQSPAVAATCFKLSLKHNPYLWTSFKALTELGEKVDPKEYFIGTGCPNFSCHYQRQWLHTASLPTAQPGGKANAGLKMAASQEDLPMSTPDLFFNPVLGTARASSTPRLGELPAMKLFSGDSGRQDSAGAQPRTIASTPVPATPFAWSLPLVMPTPTSTMPGPASSISGHAPSNPRATIGRPSLLKSTRTALKFTPDASADSPHATAAAPNPSTPTSDTHQPGMAYPKSVPSIARVAWSQTSGRERQREMLPSAPPLSVTPLGGLFSTPDQGEMDEEDTVGATTAIMPPPKAPVKSAMAPLRRSARISSFASRGGSPPVVRRRTLAASGRFGSPSGHRPEWLRNGPSRRSPRKSTSADEVQNIGMGSAMRRSLLFGSKSAHSMLQDTTNQDHPDVCASRQQGEESVGGEQREKGEKGDDTAKGEEGTRVEDAMQDSVNGLMSLLCHLATAYLHLESYELVQCAKSLQILPQAHLQTAWVQTSLAKAHLFTGRYKKAAEIFAAVHCNDPHRQEDMDYYSSALWQLNKVATLEVLAEELKQSDSSRPEAWCALGNVKSKYQNSTAAIKCFQKATEIAPSHAYAHTLLGIEYSVAEEHDRAITSLKTAVACNPRLFHAWFAMGMAYDSQEKHELASVQYRKAFSINRQSTLVCSQLGLCLSRLNKPKEGLELINHAIKLDPKMPVARFNKAVALTATGQLEDGLQELQILSKLVPKEAKVYIQMAKLLHMLDRDQEAIQQLSLALNCDRENITIRQEIDHLLQAQGAATRAGPNLSLSAHHSMFEVLEEDDNDDDDVADDEDPMGVGPDEISGDDNADNQMEA